MTTNARRLLASLMGVAGAAFLTAATAADISAPARRFRLRSTPSGRRLIRKRRTSG